MIPFLLTCSHDDVSMINVVSAWGAVRTDIQLFLSFVFGEKPNEKIYDRNTTRWSIVLERKRTYARYDVFGEINFDRKIIIDNTVNRSPTRIHLLHRTHIYIYIYLYMYLHDDDVPMYLLCSHRTIDVSVHAGYIAYKYSVYSV